MSTRKLKKLIFWFNKLDFVDPGGRVRPVWGCAAAPKSLEYNVIRKFWAECDFSTKIWGCRLASFVEEMFSPIFAPRTGHGFLVWIVCVDLFLGDEAECVVLARAEAIRE
ncbi:hypothetical protein KQI84_08090 [bacterium]|nr:hypothetical protein [bacterium]